jgi:signal transduction histidine kinase
MEEVAAVSWTSEVTDADAAGSAQTTATPQAVQRIPIYANGQQVGTLVVLSRNVPAAAVSSSDRFFDRLRLALLVGGLTGLVLAVILATFLVNGITRPLRRLTNAARRIASGDFSQRVAVTSPSEAAELASSFNRMAETLERDQETRHRLLSDIVHELRTPLSVIQGTAQGFVDGVIPADAAHAGIICDEASLLNKLITDLRDIALAESGELRLEKKPADMADLARQAASAVRPRAREKGVELEVVVPDGLPPAFVDSDRTLQIVGNLLENALRHTPSGGRVSVRLSGSRDSLLALQVADTGEGIPSEHLPHVFERFYRADPARPAGGTGLGLAIVKQLTEAQGGSVSVESAPGRGSVFTVTFPVSSLGAEPK